MGGELGSVYKKDASVHFALCFPDTYEVGMSHLGSAILYEMLNSMEDVWAERVYAPWIDMGEALRRNGEKLCSLEADRPLDAFDMVGFNLSYEMCYTNVLYMLDLGGIPLFAAERENGAPIVVGGGSCVVNPEPIADFFDLFALGDGEDVTREICQLLLKHKKAGFDRKAFLREAARLEGVYVPSLYSVEYNADGTVREIMPADGAPACVKRRITPDFNNTVMVTKPVLPYIGVVHDRCVLEIMRGCTRGCRFCQAGFIYRPVRERDPEVLIGQAKRIIEGTGYDEISLASLSSGDYSRIEELAEGLLTEFENSRVSVSLPSMRVDSFKPALAQKLQQVRQTGLTFAPEAGSQRLRDVINKNVTEADILDTAESAFRSGSGTIKLYFMVGLPTETEEDLDGIAELVGKIRERYYEVPKAERLGGRLAITVSAACFVPKPQTPFMWEAQDTVEVFKSKLDYLRKKLSQKGVKFNYHNAKLSFLEAVFARGDRRLAPALLNAYKSGCIFDSWQDCFDMEKYNRAFETAGIDPAWYANRVRNTDEVLPFSHLDYLIDPKYLLAERESALAGNTAADCRESCRACGLQKNGCRMHGGGK